MKFPVPDLRTICEKTRKQFTRLLPLAGVVVAVLTLTGASPIGRRPIGVGIPPTLGNYPATSIPLSANTTVAPDAAPTNATSMNVSTSTDFKGTLEGNPTTGVVRVTDAHPAGTYAITVKAFGSNGDSTTATFNLTVTTPKTCLPVSFAPAAHYGSFGQGVGSFAVGDFDSDGKQDLVMTGKLYIYVSYVLISYGDGAGHISHTDNIPFSLRYIHSVAVGDFNGDGKEDLAVSDSGVADGSHYVRILLGDGAGHFSAATNIDTGPGSIIVGDFNGDGKQDFAVAEFNSNKVSISLGDGAGGFSAPTDFGAGIGYPYPVVGDFNGDGKQDLAVAKYESNNVSILIGDGTGHFADAVSFTVGTGPQSVAVGDFNYDSKQDLAVANQQSHDVSILLGDGGGHFTRMNFPVGDQHDTPVRLAVGDFNGDGQQDLAITDYFQFMSIFTGDGTGHFGVATKLNFGGDHCLVVGDFNGDGKQDLAAAGVTDISIFLRDCLCTDCPKPTLGSYPDTTIASSGDTIVTPDATPSNTTSINVSTSTNFKGRLEGDPTTGVVRVTDAHPAGAYTVTIKALDALDSSGASASTTFTLTVTTPEPCDPVSFAAPLNFNIGASPGSVAVGDFNGDGKQDLAAALDRNVDAVPGMVAILLGDGAGNFSDPTNFDSQVTPSSIAVDDFNGDGKQDLAVTSFNTRLVSILLGDGRGNFSGPGNFNFNYYSNSVAAGDFNRDGKQDLAITQRTQPGNVLIMIGDGAGNFSRMTNPSTSGVPYAMAVGDFNGDGNQDLAAANFVSVMAGNVSILLGDGTGNFSAALHSPFNAGAGQPGSIAVGDFDGDGNQDLAVANASLSILLGDGTGNFSGPTNLAAGNFPNSVAVGDFNGDGKQDLAVANLNSANISIFVGDGIGSFTGPINFATGVGPTWIVVGDFNGDGKQDLATANHSSPSGGSVSILLNNCTGNDCTVCHKHTTLTLPCSSMELQRHLDHGDPPGACPSD
jgi:VCBS repeat protein/FG-GAP repeat protein